MDVNAILRPLGLIVRGDENLTNIAAVIIMFRAISESLTLWHVVSEHTFEIRIVKEEL